jgi:uncharacterized membrane protein
MAKKLNRSLSLVSAGSLLLAASLFTIQSSAIAGEKYEKCYGIAKIGENHGWDKEINPGKYASNQDYDGHAWKFVQKGTCLEKGGQLQPFAGIGTPKIDG